MAGAYDDRFFEENATVAMAGARVILPQVLKDTEACTVIDVGCGSGAWLSVADAFGCFIYGVDGYVSSERLLIQDNEFELRDLTGGYDCTGFDLAICLEVGEHLPATSALALVAGLCKARYVLFSGAHPGQRGVNHINEQWSSWWGEFFAQHGYVGSCDIRDLHWDDDTVEWFYRENIILFATEEDLTNIGYSIDIRDEIHPRRPR